MQMDRDLITYTEVRPSNAKRYQELGDPWLFWKPFLLVTNIPSAISNISDCLHRPAVGTLSAHIIIMQMGFPNAPEITACAVPH